MSRSLPTRALPVAFTRFSPLAVRGISVRPVCRPLRDHSVSPWRMMKTRGVDMAVTGEEGEMIIGGLIDSEGREIREPVDINPASEDR